MMFLGKCGLQLIQKYTFLIQCLNCKHMFFMCLLSSPNNGEGTSICIISGFQRANVIQSLDNLNLS